MNSSKILDSVQRYYSGKVRTHGATPRGVDWNSAASQRLRFGQLIKLIDCTGFFTINDYGCGYGALSDYLREEGFSFQYCGFDISQQMIDQPRELHSAMSQVTFISEQADLRPADYTVASGIFNLKLRTSTREWQTYMLHTLENIDGLSLRGFAFNV